ncbi:LacI family DNA-binding transcriptional regulator [Microbacterium sp. A93]|uniref:LacI family DNA-binding transcriptional regulator n=1 Tax=Microbacterium sp. A93 TaxID=3450716 RepID=UPI003F427DBC
MVSIADVAREAGVSPTTVSHVLSGHRRVSAPRARAVREAMEKLQYTPSRAARTLATGSTKMLALVVPDISNSFFAELAKGAESAAQASGYNVLLANTDFDHEKERAYLEVIASKAVDGVIYAAGLPPTARELRSVLGALPTILVDEEVADTGFDAVVSENDIGGKLIAEHLLALGHRRCLIIDAPDAPTSNALRVKGFLSAWEAAGGLAWLEHGDFTLESGVEALLRANELMERERITSVFATNDLMALGALSALSSRGVHVPSDVSLVGFDDVFAAKLVAPNLTTVKQDVAELGRMSVELLLKRLAGLDDARHRLTVPVELVTRQSTGQVRSA